MKRLFILLLLAAPPLFASIRLERCVGGSPKDAHGNWQWLDRDCKFRTRKELDRILADHKNWLAKYREGSSRISQQASADPLRAELAGAELDDADLTRTNLEGADLNAADLSGADLTDAILSDADLTRAVLAYADLTRANLNGADLADAVLAYADLTGARLSSANLTGAQLLYAELSNADLSQADLTGARLSSANLTGAQLLYAELSNADLQDVDLSYANLFEVDLTGAFLHADLTGASLVGADLTGLDLVRMDLTGADLGGVDLSDAKLEDIDMSGADLRGAQFWNVDFDPKVIPAASGIAGAAGLWTLRWYVFPKQELPKQKSKLSFWQRVAHWFGDRYAPGNRNPMLDLRKALHDAGYVEAEGQVNLAYHRMEQAWWQEVLFDWSCEWGSNWRRPFQIVISLWLACSVVYWALLRFTRRNRLYVIGKKGKREQRLMVGQRGSAPGWFHGEGVAWWHPKRLVGSPWRRVRWELRLYSTAALFSLMSVLNLGVQGLDLGRWVRLIHRREFDLQARGWIRAVAGVQSLLSVALLALAVISYLGHPIE